MPSPTATRADITRLETKVDQLISDHVKSTDLDKLEQRLTAQIKQTADGTYSKDYIDAIKNDLVEVKQRVGTEWARMLERLGVVASIIYVLFNILHSVGR